MLLLWMLSESVIRNREIDMSRPFMLLAVVACLLLLVAAGLPLLFGMFETYTELDERFTAQGIFVDVTDGFVYAEDFVVHAPVPHRILMNMNEAVDEWVWKWPITCNELGTQVVRVRDVDSVGNWSIVETFVVIQDNTGQCLEEGP